MCKLLQTMDATVATGADIRGDAPSSHVETNSDADDTVWGRTPGGTVFKVPATWDMMRSLLDPRLGKTPADVVTVCILVSYVLLFLALSSGARTPVMLLLFAFWRAAYNGGIGYLLYNQSNYRLLTKMAEKYKVFDKSDWWAHGLIMKSLQTRLNKSEAEVRELPLEFKTWILFRHLVDLILMSDFVSYVLLGLSVLHRTNHSWLVVFARWSAGLVLLAFNLWVKMDAHRVVKDYAWYWGDFFFLEDVNLTFDGVFELAPHPMYSIGYAAYYGASLMSSSMTLFTASILAHSAQFWFLLAVENPHIEKTYNSGSDVKIDVPDCLEKPSPKALIGFLNFNFTRSSDLMLAALVVSTSLLSFVAPNSISAFAIFAVALTWKLLHVVGLGVLLRAQSENKKWTRLFLKYGLSAADAYQQWQAIYNSTLVMSYVSLFVLSWRTWVSPLEVPFWVFRCILGSMLICLQAWTSHSIYDTLGEYGWFYGDFFYIKNGHQLTYSGIYRYLNHPERHAGIAGIWGLSLICCSNQVTVMAFVWTFCNIAFIQFVEKPHMRKLYGSHVERESGVRKNFKKQSHYLPTWLDLQNVEDKLKQLWNDHVSAHLKNIENLRPRVEGAMVDTRKVLKQYPGIMTNIIKEDKPPAAEGYTVKTERLVYRYGEPVIVTWTCGKQRHSKDWIGLYRYEENDSKVITNISSAGRWIAIDPSGYSYNEGGIEDFSDTKGQVKFAGRRLFWQPGRYEVRYHHKGKHNVLAVSEPFDIVAKPSGLKKPLKDIVKELLDLNATALEVESLEELSLPSNLILARFVHGIELIYGVEIAPFVVQADGSASKLASRLIEIDQTLSSLSG